MRNYPDDKYDHKDLARLNAEDWMVECLKMNPDYTSWGPYEDYMCGDKGRWNSRVIKETWLDFGPWELDCWNEIANFYFEIDRAAMECESCGGGGYNPETQKLADDWYSFYNEEWISLSGGRRFNNKAWHNHLTQHEVDALWEQNRLRVDFKDKPTAEQVNEWNKTGMGHDAINRSICVRARAEKMGVFGYCKACDGYGRVFTESTGSLGLVLWVLHPRKGCSRGVHIKNIERKELPDVVKFLRVAASRNAERFSKLVAPSVPVEAV